MTSPLVRDLPPHLARYRVDQAYGSYTPREHAVWRHIMRRLTAHLEHRAHPSYLDGLKATGIGLEAIPSLEDMNAALARLGWSAIGVRGFIPPAVFTELQAMRVLAIACDIRSHEHVEYTPAPDIVHESAGHAPIIADPRYADYLQRCGVVGFKAIASLEDQAVFEAIRNLSVVKEDPQATPEDVLHAEARLQAASASRRYVSESTKASRLYWWTAEYGLVGSLEAPRIYGAGILSSLGESAHCLTPAVRKLPLAVECVDQDYDITTMQPQLFVARDFEHLFEVLEAFEATLAWRRGGDAGLLEALRSRTINHLVLSDGLEVTGRVAHRWETVAGTGMSTVLVRLAGPVMASRDGKALDRPHCGTALVAFGPGRLPERGPFRITLPGGLELSGFRIGLGETLDFRATLEGHELDLPAWTWLHLSDGLPSVAGGPADPGTWDHHFGELTAFAAGEGEVAARARKVEALGLELREAYEAVGRLRRADDPALRARVEAAIRAHPGEWLLKEEMALVSGASQA